jgi:AcrR family transcriptional regulator
VKSQKIFCKHGIKRVIIEEICSEAGVSKMTFYRTYSSKIELVEQVPFALTEQGIAKYHQIMSADESFDQRTKAMIETKKRDVETFGEELIKDIYLSDNEQLKVIVEKYRSQSLQIFIDDLRKAQNDGWVRPKLKPEFVLEMLNVIYLKMADPAFIALFKEMKEATEELTNFLFYGILSQRS